MSQHERVVPAFLRLVALACLFSWALWIPVIASQQGWIGLKIPAGPWGSFGPAIAALVLTALDGKKGSLRQLLSPLVRFRAALRWYLIAIALPIAAGLGVIALARIASTEPAGFQHLDQLYLALPLFLLILVVGGPLGEEIGWRGYALPRLLTRFEPLQASLMIAAAWMLWHLPLFWMEGAAQQGSSLVSFAIFVLASAILFTWFYQKTSGNLLLAVLLHASINFASFGMTIIAPWLDLMPLANMAIVAFAAVPAGLIAWRWLREPFSRQLQAGAAAKEPNAA